MFSLFCPISPLTSKGAYRNLRFVLAVTDWYLLATEYLECTKGGCTNTTILSWDVAIMNQLPDDLKTRFPAVLTYKCALDKALVVQMRGRTVGNTPSAMRNMVHENHTQRYCEKTLQYLADCRAHQERKNEERRCRQQPPVKYEFDPPPNFKPIPGPTWFQAVHTRDVYDRLDVLRASITSTLGTILKIDSTKKVSALRAYGIARNVGCG